MNLFDLLANDPNLAAGFKRVFSEPEQRYLNGELIRIEPGREGSPVCHVVWDSYAQREVRTYLVEQATEPKRHRTDAEIDEAIDADLKEQQ